MHPRKRLDIGWGDLAAGIWGALRPGAREAAAREAEALWSPAGEAVACLSIRTGFDALLATLGWAPGTEVLVSAVTIPHMIDLLVEHGLVPVPVDLDMQTLELAPGALARAVTPRTRAILVAHVFGSRMALDEAVAVAEAHGLMLIEDCAQAWLGDPFRGHPAADVSMFSFGTIKTATALGGALLVVRDEGLRGRLREALGALAPRPEGGFARRALKYAGLKLLGDSTLLYGALARGLRAAGRDHDQVIMAASRGFSGPDFLSLIRRAPSRGLLRLLARRLRGYDPAAVARRARAGDRLAALIPETIEVVGRRAALRTWWLFPVVVARPEVVRLALGEAGFDAALGSTSLTWVPAPEDRPELTPQAARRVMSSILYLPLHGEMSDKVLKTLADCLAQEVAGAARLEGTHVDDGVDGAPRGAGQRAGHPQRRAAVGGVAGGGQVAGGL